MIKNNKLHTIGVLFSIVFLLKTTICHAKTRVANKEEVIVLLHGIGSNAKSFEVLQEKLETAFPFTQVIALTSSEGPKSVLASIEDQATAAFIELQEKIKNLTDSSILIIGQSQGAMRGYKFLKKHADKLNIKGLITLGAPWEGAEGARMTPFMLEKQLTQEVKNELELLSTSMGYEPEHLETNLKLEVQQNQAMCAFPGASDLIVGSNFLKQVAQDLQNIKIPILSIASEQSELEALSPNSTQLKGKLKSLNKLYAWFVAGKHTNRRHDMMVPLYSQHALTIVKNMKNFERYCVNGAFHSATVLSVPVPLEKNALKHPLVIQKIIDFAKSKLKK